MNRDRFVSDGTTGGIPLGVKCLEGELFRAGIFVVSG